MIRAFFAAGILLMGHDTWGLSGHVCKRERAETYMTSYNQAFLCQERYTTSCGHLDWRRCTRYRVQTCYTPRERYAVRYHVVETCCPGWSDDGTGACNIAILFKPIVDLPARMRAPAPLSRERPPVSVRMVTMATTVSMRGTIGTSGKQLSPFSVEYLLSLEQQSQYMSTDGIEKQRGPESLPSYGRRVKDTHPELSPPQESQPELSPTQESRSELSPLQESRFKLLTYHTSLVT
ncbi:uncharacterized protein LOC128168785 isoform X2 [Crassostrea angulata]|uniref:uncharacterized protein LOC128168785 isoform X2 n=1 Tax=Magallana angulata TaxID=2784310 RepID=UPI0022B12E40|nr:uncharacterized protein LOC128168785 isoform X2 [Crassostrea angulata]